LRDKNQVVVATRRRAPGILHYCEWPWTEQLREGDEKVDGEELALVADGTITTVAQDGTAQAVSHKLRTRHQPV